MKFAIAATLLLTLAGCTVSDSTARGVLDNYGLRLISTNGRAWMGCSESDAINVKFTAKTQTDKIVHGVICCKSAAFESGCTVRF